MSNGVGTLRPIAPPIQSAGDVARLRLPSPAGAFHAVVDTLPDSDRLRPFLMSVVSDCDLWMYVSSTGALTAGRNNEDRALFPYETDDKLHRLAGISGPVTRLRIRPLDADRNGHATVWKPFADRGPHITRQLHKSILSDRLTFEEHNAAIGLTFRYTWRACDAFGWVRTCELISAGPHRLSIEILDGVDNLLPANAPLALQRAGSCLINAYSQIELDVPSALAIYSLASQIIDRAEPAESLHANVAFQVGIPHAKRLLSIDQLDAFLDGRPLEDEHLLTGRRGAFFASGRIELEPGASKRWHIVLDAHRTQAQVAALQALLNAESARSLSAKIESALDAASLRLAKIVADTDGQQLTADTVVCAHHASNVLFNGLRGGVFANGVTIDAADFARAVAERNRPVAARHLAFLASLPISLNHAALLDRVADQADPQLTRLAMEYLPLTFGRRHGDPSRPWNRFDIRTVDEQGTPILNYQGNWRDIFQNWEALVLGTPTFVLPMIAKFVNASTPDGFNPYRVTREGIEWEVPDPHDPWAHIGYWGDHQLVYLLKLLETAQRVDAGALGRMLSQRLFAYADVPYRLRPYARMLEDRQNTVDFDWPRQRVIESRLGEIGTDARLVRDGGEDSGSDVLLVTLAEKLLVPALSKLSNFVAGGGIWMNTQRPEWNDANNALVGNGVSAVTLCYLRRYLAFCARLFASQADASFSIRASVARWFDRVGAIYASTPVAPNDREIRRTMLDALGAAFESYRDESIPTPTPVGSDRAPKDNRKNNPPSSDPGSDPTGVGVSVSITPAQLADFFRHTLAHVDASIRANRRRDGLFHAYNLLHLKDDAIELSHLPIMLEGQVAALSSGTLTSADAIDVVEKLFSSPLWRDDQQSFMLYPIVELPGFMQKNAVSEMAAKRSAFASKLLAADDRSILHRDGTGQIRFNAGFRNARDVRAALDRLAAPADAREEILELYEKTFGHHAFTGRSGSMYGYEGIGCIYWHMVAKLLLAIQENALAAEGNAFDRLATLYARVRAGLGFNKSAEVYGAFPLDAYSHTPLHAGAQQPGMTGQVKEEILTRFGELGVSVDDGIVRFDPILLDTSEFLAEPADWRLVGRDGALRTIRLDAGTLGFTFAATPILYRLADRAATIVHDTDGGSTSSIGNALSPAASRQLLSRGGGIDRIEVLIPRPRRAGQNGATS